MIKRQKLSIERAKQALSAYRKIPIKFMDVPLEKTLEITHTQNMYAYDAYLIQCAQQTGTSLLALDNALQAIAEKMGISVLETRS
jgi:predicted nucleic acid-binding protein